MCNNDDENEKDVKTKGKAGYSIYGDYQPSYEEDFYM